MITFDVPCIISENHNNHDNLRSIKHGFVLYKPLIFMMINYDLRCLVKGHFAFDFLFKIVSSFLSLLIQNLSK